MCEWLHCNDVFIMLYIDPSAFSVNPLWWNIDSLPLGSILWSVFTYVDRQQVSAVGGLSLFFQACVKYMHKIRALRNQTPHSVINTGNKYVCWEAMINLAAANTLTPMPLGHMYLQYWYKLGISLEGYCLDSNPCIFSPLSILSLLLIQRMGTIN